MNKNTLVRGDDRVFIAPKNLNADSVKHIDTSEYDVVICVKGRHGKLFENGKDTTKGVKSVKFDYAVDGHPELTVTRHILGK